MPTIDWSLTGPRSVQSMLDVEAALAEALADAGVIPAASAAAIRRAADARAIDLTTLAVDAVRAGNPVIPLVAQLTPLVAANDPVAAGHVHLGVTSQDVMDTALVLRLRGDAGTVVAHLTQAADAAAALAERYAATPIAGRTWLQQATPTTFGAKAAVWMQGIDRASARVADALEHASVVQLGGATGSLASLGEAGPAVIRALAARLGLRVPDGAWHTERTAIVDLACALGLACGALGKVGRDISLLAQTEVGEVAEPSAPGRGGSSAMPHKRNPVASAQALAAATRAPGLVATMIAAMPQEHERALGGWQAEWETLPTLVALTADAAGVMAEALSGLQVDTARMRANLDAAGGVARAEGLVTALAPRLGRDASLRAVEALCRSAASTGQALVEVARASDVLHPHLTPDQIATALNPDSFVAPARAAVDLALRHRPARAVSGGSNHG